MAIFNAEAFQSSANLSLWFKVRSGDPLTLADVPEIIPLRWTFFRDKWPQLHPEFLQSSDSYSDPDYFRAVLQDMDGFVKQQRLKPSVNNPFSGSEIYYRFFPVFDSVLVDSVSTTREEDEIIEKKTVKVRSFSKNDFLKIKRDITAYRDVLADSVGLGDPEYNRIYNRGTVVSQITPTISDMNLMLVLQGQISSVNFILANMFSIDASIDPFALAKLNANNSEISIGQYSSGYLVKLHFGEDLQGLATRHMGSPDKWIDIAIANGLREPYIDEVGEQLFFLSNGRDNQLNIRATDEFGQPNSAKLHINQFVFVQSNSNPFPSQRLITSIKEVPLSGEIIVTLSGEANLGQYLLADQASIRVFKPNTVNSSQYVLIPSTQKMDGIRKDETPWFQASSAADEKRTKIDIAVDESGALLFSPNGDLALSYGLANAIQATKLKLLTEQGSNRYHPQYGIVNVAGQKSGDDVAIKSALVNSITSQIQADPRFDRVESLNVARAQSSTGVAYNINLVVRLVGSSTLIPISFTVAT